MIGSVAAGVLREASCNLLVVPPMASSREEARVEAREERQGVDWSYVSDEVPAAAVTTLKPQRARGAPALAPRRRIRRATSWASCPAASGTTLITATTRQPRGPGSVSWSTAARGGALTASSSRSHAEQQRSPHVRVTRDLVDQQPRAAPAHVEDVPELGEGEGQKGDRHRALLSQAEPVERPVERPQHGGGNRGRIARRPPTSGGPPGGAPGNREAAPP